MTTFSNIMADDTIAARGPWLVTVLSELAASVMTTPLEVVTVEPLLVVEDDELLLELLEELLEL